MIETTGMLFFRGTFLTAFICGFPVGASSLEMLRLSSLGQRGQAWMLAAGVSAADAVWALFALAGLLPWLGEKQANHKGVFFLLAAAITFFLACRAWSEKRGNAGGHRQRPGTRPGSQKKRTSFWKGAILGISYPLTFGSWIVALAIFKDFGWRIPGGPMWIALFFAVVFLGYFAYLAFLQLIFRRFQEKLSLRARGWWQDAPGWLLLALSIVFLALALTKLFRHG
jgi:threonine/homoserine/homoserine lactone efflux protein